LSPHFQCCPYESSCPPHSHTRGSKSSTFWCQLLNRGQNTNFPTPKNKPQNQLSGESSNRFDSVFIKYYLNIYHFHALALNSAVTIYSFVEK
jgi:hypothetical protein